MRLEWKQKVMGSLAHSGVPASVSGQTCLSYSEMSGRGVGANSDTQCWESVVFVVLDRRSTESVNSVFRLVYFNSSMDMSSSNLSQGVKRARPQNNAARERSRVKTLRSAFLELQQSLPAVPPNTKLSKLDVLVLATAYIYHLTRTLEGHSNSGESSDKNNSCGSIRTVEGQRLRRQLSGSGFVGTAPVSTCSSRAYNSTLAKFGKNFVGQPYPSLTMVNLKSEQVKCDKRHRDEHFFTMGETADASMSAEWRDRRFSHPQKSNLESENKRVSSRNGLFKESKRSCEDCASGGCVLQRAAGSCHELRMSSGGLQYTGDSADGSDSAAAAVSGRMLIGQGKQQERQMSHLLRRRASSTLGPLKQGKVGIMHPVKKWPMRSRLYDGILTCGATISP